MVVFFTQIAIARMLTPESIGIVALSSSLFVVVKLFARWGLSEAIIVESDKRPKLTDTIFWIRLAYVLIVLIVVLAFLPVIQHFYESHVVTIFYILLLPVLLGLFTEFPLAYLQKNLRLKQQGFIDLVTTILASITVVVMAYNGFDLWALTLYVVLNFLLPFFAFWIVSPYRPRFKFSIEDLKWFYHFGKNIFLGESAGMLINQQGDNAILGTIKGPVPLGFYSMANKLSSATQIVSISGILTASLPTFSLLRDNSVKLRQAYEYIVRNLSRLIIPTHILLGILAPELITFFFGQNWLPAVPIFRILLIYLIVNQLSRIEILFHYGIGSPKSIFKAQLLGLSIFLIFAIPLTIYWGSIGMALTLDVAFSFSYWFMVKQTRKKIGNSIWPHLKIITAATLISALVVLLTELLLPKIALTRIILQSIIFGISYVSVLLILEKNQLVEDVKKIHKLVFSKSKNRR